MKGRRNAAIMLRRQNLNKKIQLAAAATGLQRKQMFECLVLSSIKNLIYASQIYMIT